MIWLKLAAAGAVMLALVGVGWWLVSTVKENERLTINNATLEQARLQDAEVIAFLQKDNAAKEKAVQARTQKIVEMGQRLEKARREVRTITKTVVTEVERECLLQPVPAAVVDFMLDNPAIDPTEGDG